jgi:tRNA modification GTPase
LLSDTAGLRATGDAVEREGIRRAWAAGEAADMRLFVIDGIASGPESLTDSEHRFGNETESLRQGGDLAVFSKNDLTGSQAASRWLGLEGLSVSAVTGSGLERLEAALAGRAAAVAQGAGLIVRARHRMAVEDAAVALDRAQADHGAPEIAAEHVRAALNALGRIVGRVDVEAVLDRVFSAFCIGK